MGKFQFASRTPNFGVGYEELSGSPRIKYAREQGMSATRRLRCNWSEANLLCAELLGVIEFVAGVPNFAAPMSMPGVKLDFLVVDTIDIEAFDTESPDGSTLLTLGTSASSYENVGAVVTAQYKTVDLNQDKNRPETPSGTFLTVHETSGLEYQTLPGYAFTWADTGKPLPGDSDAGMMIPTGQLTMSWDRVALPPENTFKSMRGKLNSTKFMGYDPGFVLLTGRNKERKFQFGNSDDALYRIDYTFSCKDRSWNEFYDPRRNDWFAVDGPEAGEEVGSDPPYDSADLNQLFQYEG